MEEDQNNQDQESVTSTSNRQPKNVIPWYMIYPCLQGATGAYMGLMVPTI